MDLSTNRLRSLPSEIAMKRMMYFHVQNNSLTSVPSSLCNLEFLAMLTLDGNRLTSLPTNIGDLKRTLFFAGFARII